MVHKTASQRVADRYLKQAGLWGLVKEKFKGVLPSPVELNKGFSRYIQHRKFENPETGNEVHYKALPESAQSQVRLEYAESIATRKLEDPKYHKEENLQGGVFREGLDSHEFEDSDLRGATFLGTKVQNSEFVRSNLSSADFTGAEVVTNTYEESNLSRSKFDSAKIHNVNYDLTNLSGASFNGSTLSQIEFESSKIIGATFNKASIANTKFLKCNMTESDFSGVVFSRGTEFIGCNLTGCDFSGASIPKSFRIKGCDVSGVDFSNIKGQLTQGMFVDCKGVYPNKTLQAFFIY
jgi:uncharacterized protein YjbI with pentapeptide repeats